MVAGDDFPWVLQALSEESIIDADGSLSCLVSARTSRRANVACIVMHSTDHVVAFTKFAETDPTVPCITARFGLSEGTTLVFPGETTQIPAQGVTHRWWRAA